MTDNTLPSIERYENHLRETGEWCLRSVQHGKGGSCAHYSPLLGWSKPYPETSGYLIPTLIKLADHLKDERYRAAAVQVGEWLLSIQSTEGHWHGGLHPNTNTDGSVFNTGQILKGMAALFRDTQDERWREAGARGASWLAAGVGENGLWPPGDYQSEATPSYYSHVAWPMLEMVSITDDKVVRDAACRYLDTIKTRIKDNGVVSHWGFKENGPAFTHTIAYTIRGFQESARLIDDFERYHAPMIPALETLYGKTERSGGKLPGSFDENWQATGDYVCLTGNAQLAICFLLLESHETDLRLVNAASKLNDYVASAQRNSMPLGGVKGGVAGSKPLWGKYMIARYPNWAAKYFCDSLLLNMARLNKASADNTDGATLGGDQAAAA